MPRCPACQASFVVNYLFSPRGARTRRHVVIAIHFIVRGTGNGRAPNSSEEDRPNMSRGSTPRQAGCVEGDPG